MKITAYEVREDEREYLQQEAAKNGVKITLVPEPMTEENIDLSVGADGITILGETRLDEKLMEEIAKRRIKVVATRTIGYDHMDLNAAKNNGIHICNGYYAPDGVAEYTIMLMLMALRNYKQALYRANANDYSLRGLIGKELRNLTVGIIGTGKIGALGLDVIEEEEGIYHQDLRSDILSNRNMAYIRQFPNVTMTQHMAFYTKEAVRSMAESGVVNILKCLRKEENPNMIC